MHGMAMPATTRGCTVCMYTYTHSPYMYTRTPCVDKDKDKDKDSIWSPPRSHYLASLKRMYDSVCMYGSVCLYV